MINQRNPEMRKVIEAQLTDEEEQRRVQEVLQDEELRTMLMDPETQRVLQQCGNDHAAFQRYMQDPVWAYKIKKLFKAGLVGVAK
jgi:hypothetical protein